jgi:cyclopropane-fatty-acyl-phospholipid synthase
MPAAAIDVSEHASPRATRVAEPTGRDDSPHPGAAGHAIDRILGHLLRQRFGHAPLRFTLADRTDLFDSGPDRVATVRLQDRRTLLGLTIDPERYFGDAYGDGRIEVQGDLANALEAAYRALGGQPDGAHSSRVGVDGHSVPASRANARHHYDLGNDFYRLWLDERMVYSCAYFPREGMSLEEAQVAKFERICAKLRLRPGERVVEAGCGWGTLALHMAGRYGVSVRAFNVSAEQVRYARSRAAAEGLSGRVEYVEDDYRNIDGRFDAFVSVGMLEHVGRENFGHLGAVIQRSLDPEHGRGLLHFIGRDRPRPLNAWIRKRIFPGAYAPTLSEVATAMVEAAGLSVLDVENLRPHYATTLGHWLSRFDAVTDQVRARYGEDFTRAWRLYLAGSEASFRTGWLQLFQVVFGVNGRDVPWGRGGLAEDVRPASPLVR